MISGFSIDAEGYWILADPDAVLPYKLDWLSKGWLQNGDIIVASTWDVDPAVVEGPQDHNDGAAWIQLGPSVVGVRTVTNKITTSSGFKDNRTFRMIVQGR